MPKRNIIHTKPRRGKEKKYSDFSIAMEAYAKDMAGKKIKRLKVAKTRVGGGSINASKSHPRVFSTKKPTGSARGSKIGEITTAKGTTHYYKNKRDPNRKGTIKDRKKR